MSALVKITDCSKFLTEQPDFSSYFIKIFIYKGWNKTTATASRTRKQRSLAVRHQTKNEVHSITYR